MSTQGQRKNQPQPRENQQLRQRITQQLREATDACIDWHAGAFRRTANAKARARSAILAAVETLHEMESEKEDHYEHDEACSLVATDIAQMVSDRYYEAFGDIILEHILDMAVEDPPCMRCMRSRD